MIDEGEIVDFEHFFLPTLTHFENGNGWKGSLDIARFELEPPVDGSIHTVVWYGPFCRELSEIDCQREFPLSQEGLDEAADWLHTVAAEMNAHPRRSYEECLAYRAQVKAKMKEAGT